MLQTLNPYNSTNARTAQIMARYRPIAPRPDVPPENPALDRVLPHLEARPSRIRKRGRTSLGPPLSGKRLRSGYLQGLLSPPYRFPLPSPAKALSLHAFAHPPNLPPVTTLAGFSTPAPIVTVPLLHHPSGPPASTGKEKGIIDLNKPACVLKEKDFLHQLQAPTNAATTTVFTPQPVRLVSSTITVWSIRKEPKPVPTRTFLGAKVEEEVESEALPAVVTDSNHRVRAVSSGYKDLVGQPECLWLDTVGQCKGNHGGTACKRICGEVIFRIQNSGLPGWSNSFSGRARIEWEINGKKMFVDTFFDATRLYCESKDYQFAWRFYTQEACQSYSKV
ncbi:hypothetical protein LguiB_017385 [Lonicera macranthoides]